MKKTFYLIILVVMVSGCATTAGYEAVLNTWVGHNENSLIASWGPPQNAYHMANGKRAIEYAKGRNIQTGGYTYTQPQTTYHYGSVGNTGYYGTSTQYVTKTTPVYNINLWCKTSFILDSSGSIETWRWEGNNCVANMPKVTKNTPTHLTRKNKPIYETRMTQGQKNVQSDIIAKACKEGKIPSTAAACK